MIDHRRQFIMIHIPKTGGTSLKVLLWPNNRETQHEVASRFRVRDWEEYFTFAFVRHPYDRLASQYWYHVKSEYQGYYAKKFVGLKQMSFLDYLHKFAKSHYMGFEPQRDYIVHGMTSCPIDFVGRFENLHHDAQIVLNKLGVPACLPHKLKSGVESYEHILTDEAKKAIFSYYEVDFEYFGYQP